MTLTLPFTNEQFNHALSISWKIIKGVTLIGVLIMIGVGLTIKGGGGFSLLVLGIIFGTLVWIIQIFCWRDDGLIKFKCEDEV